MEWGIIHNCFTVPTAFYIGLIMKSFIFLIASFGVVYVKSQNYGGVPPRPQFLGATLVQQPRPLNRQRTVNLRPEVVPISDQLQQTRYRRPQLQPVGRTRQFPQTFEQPRANLIEDSPIQYKTKITGPTPSPPFPQQNNAKLLTPRPVTEEEINEDDDESATTATTPSTTVYPTPFRPNYTPSIQSNQGPIGFQKPQVQPSAFRPSSPLAQPIAAPQTAAIQGRQLIRPQLRPIPQPQPQLPLARPSPQPIRQQQQQQQEEESEEEEEEPQYFRQPPARLQQQKKQPEPVRQQIIDQDQVRPQQSFRPVQRPQQQPQPQRQEYTRPLVQREPHVKASNAQREKKPVVQTIRKYHEENEDGSITWGYENDDGSFKEETIGVDCVTRGKYGYFDPDGVKREYTYQTGIPCDKEQQEAEEAASASEGFIDYTNNKYVFPNGDEIDLEAMVKNRARKPVAHYRN